MAASRSEKMFLELFNKPNFKGGLKFVLTYDSNREVVVGQWREREQEVRKRTTGTGTGGAVGNIDRYRDKPTTTCKSASADADVLLPDNANVPTLENMTVGTGVTDFGVLEDVVPCDLVVAVHSPSFWSDVLTKRNLGLGEGYMDQTWEMRQGSVCDFVRLGIVNNIDKQITLGWWAKLQILWMYIKMALFSNFNKDVAGHYDVGDSVMVPMLGRTGNYTCGYALDLKDDLDQMQLNKMNLVLSKLRLKPGERILDLGCGNGGLLIHAAQHFGVTGEGFTNSANMTRVANQNIDRNGLSSKLHVVNDDFSILSRYPDEYFDAITSIGNFEHVPTHMYEEILTQCSRILKPHGRMLLHAISCVRHKNIHDAFIQKYIFPDSGQLMLPLLLTRLQQLSMYVTDVDNIGRHYFFTLRWWHILVTRAAEKDGSIDPRVLRMFQYYLQCCMAVALAGDGALYQVLFWKNPRQCIQLHRVTSDNMQRFPLTMKSHLENTLLGDEAAEKAKKEKAIYQPPGLIQRLHRLITRVVDFAVAGFR